MKKVDNYQHKGMRKELVKALEEKGITDHKVLAAIERIPRHFFIPDNVFDKEAYKDKAFPIGEGQTISQPFTVAYQTQLLDVNPREKILEIGTGSGYQACIISELGGRVYSIERQQRLFNRTRKLLLDLNYTKIKTFFGDGFEGLPTFAPFDKIIITAAAPVIPQKLIDQLAVGGIMIIPLGKGGAQDMIRIEKTSETEYEKEVLDKFAFVPMLKGRAWER